MKTHIDHLVVMAHTLAQGVQWCEATLGITPAPGGEHAQYGTHNRLFKIATPAHPLAYLEIIAINPAAKKPTHAEAKRWFDLDDAALQAAVALEPRLIHFVANTDELQAARSALNLKTAVGCARRCRDRGARQGATTRRAHARKEEQRRMVP